MYNLKESHLREVNILDYGKIFGDLPVEIIKKLFMLQYPAVSRLYFKLFGFPDIASHVRFPVIMKLCNPKESDLILDVGCGMGAYCNTIAMKMGARCIGIDLNKENLRRADLVSDALKLNSEFHFMDARKIGFPGKRFDKVLCIEVLEHIQEHDLVIAEVARVLKPGGVLVLSTPVKSMSDEEERRAFAHPKPFREARSGYELRSLKAMMHKVGLRILKVEHWYRWFTKQAIKLMEFFNDRGRSGSWVVFYPLFIPLCLTDIIDERLRHEKGVVSMPYNSGSQIFMSHIHCFRTPSSTMMRWHLLVFHRTLAPRSDLNGMRALGKPFICAFCSNLRSKWEALL